MTLRLNGSTSGYTEIDAPSVAGSNTLVLPTGNGSAGNILGTDGSGNLSWVNGRMVQETAQASTSGTSIDFTGIPNWVKRVTVIFGGVSTNGGSNLLLQIGAGSVQTSSYASSAWSNNTTTATSTAGYIQTALTTSATPAYNGCTVITVLSSNTWVAASNIATSTGPYQNHVAAGSVALSGTLDRVRITTVNGTDTFDAGSINLLLEG
jgi:hypothetical protein